MALVWSQGFQKGAICQDSMTESKLTHPKSLIPVFIETPCIYIFFLLCARGRGGGRRQGGYRWGPPITKMGVQIYIYFFTAIQRALQVAEGHQPSAGARSRRP